MPLLFGRRRGYVDGVATNLTYSQRMLLAVRTAILEAVESGAQSGSIGASGSNESYTRYSLAQLRALEAEYVSKVNAQSGRTRRVVPDFGGAD